MKMIDHYKKAIRIAEAASETIGKARANYEHQCVLTKNAYEADLLGEKGYQDELQKLEAERDSTAERALSRILTIADEFDAEADELGRLDGSRIDDGTMKLLNSGISLSSRDWQELADMHRDNAIMTRILRERYNANRPQEKELVVVKFGQSPESRKEVFSKFVKTVYNACRSGARPSLSGSGRFKTAADFYNYLAQASLEDMQPTGEESFDNLDADFPVETENGRAENVTGKAVNYGPGDFNFGFTPVRGSSEGGNIF